MPEACSVKEQNVLLYMDGDNRNYYEKNLKLTKTHQATKGVFAMRHYCIAIIGSANSGFDLGPRINYTIPV